MTGKLARDDLRAGTRVEGGSDRLRNLAMDQTAPGLRNPAVGRTAKQVVREVVADVAYAADDAAPLQFLECVVPLRGRQIYTARKHADVELSSQCSSPRQQCTRRSLRPREVLYQNAFDVTRHGVAAAGEGAGEFKRKQGITFARGNHRRNITVGRHRSGKRRCGVRLQWSEQDFLELLLAAEALVPDAELAHYRTVRPPVPSSQVRHAAV